MTLHVYSQMSYRISGDNYNHLMAQVPEGGRLFVEIEVKDHIPAGGELPLMEPARPVDDVYDYRVIIASRRYVYWFAYPADIVSQWKESNMTPSQKYGRVLMQAKNGYPALFFELKPEEVLWAEYYRFCSVDCLASTLVREPIRGFKEYDAFMAKYGEAEGSITFWALTREQEEWYLHRKAHNHYSPFQEDPEVTSKNQKASRHTATVVLTKDTAEAPSPDQLPALTLWTKFQLWLAGYNRRH